MCARLTNGLAVCSRLTRDVSHEALIAACLLLVGSIASAKCINVRQEISGVVVDSNGQPVEGAVVVASWLERGEPRTKTEQSGSQGRFTVLIIFDAYSGSGFAGRTSARESLRNFLLGLRSQATWMRCNPCALQRKQSIQSYSCAR